MAGYRLQWDFATKYYQIGIWRGVSLHISSASGGVLQPLPTVLPHLTPPYSSAMLELRGAVAVQQQQQQPALVGKTLKLAWDITCLTDPTAPSATVHTTFSASESTCSGQSVDSIPTKLCFQRPIRASEHCERGAIIWFESHVTCDIHLNLCASDRSR
jgi:hypothetical protein